MAAEDDVRSLLEQIVYELRENYPPADAIDPTDVILKLVDKLDEAQPAKNAALAGIKLPELDVAGATDDPAKNQKLAAFARAAPSLVALTGQLLPSSDPGWRRLYRDWALQTWVLLRVNDVLHHAYVASSRAAFGGYDVVWVRSEAEVGPARRQLQLGDGEEGFLTGPFVRADDLATGDFGDPGGSDLYGGGTSATCCRSKAVTTPPWAAGRR